MLLLSHAGGRGARGAAAAAAAAARLLSTSSSCVGLPPLLILLRHGESAGLERLQEELQIPNHRVPLSAHGVQQARDAGRAVRALLEQQQAQDQQQQYGGLHRLFLFTSPFLRCVQTAQHLARELDDEQVIGYQEEVQLREQDWGNTQEPGQQARNYAERLKYGRFFYRFPDGESAADVYDRMNMFQDHFVRDIAYRRWGANASVMLVTHGLAMRLFLMRWLHWSVDEFLQVHNPPTAVPIVLARRPQLQDGCDASTPPGAAIAPQAVKSCYALTPESLALLRGVSPSMARFRGQPGTKQQLLDWRPYRVQVPPPPALDPDKEALLQQLMDVGYHGGDTAQKQPREA